MHRQQRIRRRDQQVTKRLDVRCGIEPRLPHVSSQDHGHPVVHWRHRVVGRRRDHRARVQPGRIGRPRSVPPGAPDSGDSERLAVDATDEQRLLDGLAFGVDRATGMCCLPFVEPVHGNDASVPLEHPFEGGLLGDGLRPRIDHRRTDLDVFGPHGNEAPLEVLHRQAGAGADHGENVVGRCDVEVLRGRMTLEARREMIGDLLGRVGGDEAAAHARYRIAQASPVDF